MRIVIENSSWNNIGDGFYQYSIFNMFKSIFPNCSIAMMDAPILRSFRPNEKYEKSAYHLNRIQDADIFVFSGPILGGSFLKEYAPLIREIKARGKNYVLTSIHAEAAHQVENFDFLQKNLPLLFSSRDTPSFKMFKNLRCPTYDGVCAASLVSVTCDTAEIWPEKKLIAVSFYEGEEPAFKILRDDASKIIEVMGLANWKKNNLWKLSRHLEWLKNYPTSIDEFEIVRPVHDIGYKFSHLNFARANSFLSYNPLSYLSIYRHAALTISNRVHAVLPALSFGNQAAYVGTTERNSLIDRLGFKDYIGKVIQLPVGFVQNEHGLYLNFIKVSLGDSVN